MVECRVGGGGGGFVYLSFGVGSSFIILYYGIWGFTNY